MKLKATEQGVNSAQKTEERRKLGKRSKNKGSSYERTIAKKLKEWFNLDLVRTPQSGGFAKNLDKTEGFRGDIVSADKNVDFKLHVECKNTKSWSLPSWLKQAESDCPKNKIPVVVFHQHGTSKDYIALSLEDFAKLVPSDNILKRKEG